MEQVPAVRNYGNSNQNITNIFDSWQRVEVEKQDNFTVAIATESESQPTKPPPVVRDIYRIENDTKGRLVILSTYFKTEDREKKQAKKAKQSLCGFVSAVLSHSTYPKAPYSKGFGIKRNGRFAGIFLLSSNAHVSNKATRNRKYISYSDNYTHKGEKYKVNPKPTGIYTAMMGKYIEQLDIAQQLWGRVLVVRIDLHQSHYTADSKTVSWFFKQMVSKLKRQYKFDQVGYVWAREKEEAKSQHYHCWFFLDGRKIKHSSKVIKMAKETWVKNWAGNHHIPTTKKPFRLVDSDEVKHKVVYWLSYACKGRGKGYRPPQSKDYGTSRLKP